MTPRFDPAEYEAWYHTPRGRWIGDVEFECLWRLLNPGTGATLLDVGSGTGYFSRRFAAGGLQVTALDPDPGMLAYAKGHDGPVSYIRGSAARLAIRDDSFDFTTAVTSLCFVREPARALAEMWRVSRQRVILGLLNRHSLLHLRKREKGGYRGARWDSVRTVQAWCEELHPKPRVIVRSAVFWPGEPAVARVVERLASGGQPWGGFLAVGLYKNSTMSSCSFGCSRT